MEIFFFDEIESTSKLAREWVGEKKKSLPFAISAKSQTQGRGQKGRNWSSPEGNIYFTIAMDGSDVTSDLVGWLPMKVGVLIADWLRERFNLVVDLKWPNDLLFQGRKVAGILCESTITGDHINHILIGVGVNLNQTPEVEDQLVGSVIEFCQTVSNIDDPSSDLIKFIEVHWNELELDSVKKRIGDYGLSKGQYYVDREHSNLWKCTGFNARGGILLREMISNSKAEISSAADSKSTMGQAVAQLSEFVVADLGNSVTKLSQYNAGQWSDTSLKSLKADTWIFYGSVNKPTEQDFLESCQIKKLVPIKLKKKRIYSRGSYPVDQIGIDRLAMVEGFLAQRPGVSGILVSLGTATTIDVVTAEGLHLGGWIVPGVYSSLKALSNDTYVLPDLTSDFVLDRGLGEDTRQAMSRGVTHTVYGLISEVRKALKDKPSIILTGGGAHLFESDHTMIVDKNLIFKGLRVLALSS